MATHYISQPNSATAPKHVNGRVPVMGPPRETGKGLAWSPSRCMRYLDCRLCQDACPADCLHFFGEDIEVDTACLGCGRCAAVCPTRALQLGGFAAAPNSTRAPTAYVDCRKVSPEASPEGAIRVACLGGVSTSWILELQAMNPEAQIVLLDRGWCRNCSAGRGERCPAQAALQEAQAPLREAGLSTSQIPRIESRPLPQAGMPLEIPEAVEEERLSRRNFFARAVHEAALTLGGASAGAANSQPDPNRTIPLGHSRIIPAERLSQVRALATIARRNHRPVPPKSVSQIEIAGNCRNHRICASVCPTGALQKYESGNRSGVQFNPVLCLGCARCEQSCPEGALQIHRTGTQPFAIEHFELTAHAMKVCATCEEEFAGTEGDLCPSCSKNRALLKGSHWMQGGATAR